MPSFRTIAIATALSLALIFGLLWWDGRTAQPTLRQATISSAASQTSVGGVEPAHPDERRTVLPGAAIPKIAAKPSVTDVTSPQAAPALPLLLHFYRRMRDPDQRMEGSIENLSQGDLSIVLSVLSARSRTVFRSTLEIPSQSRVVFGRDDGLNLAPGDRITLESPTYSDLVQEIR